MATSQVTRYNNHIGGKWVESSTGRTYTITNPASNESVLAEFQTSGVDDALKAVDAAHEALAGWANTPAPVRAGILFRAIEILRQRGDDIARTITLEEGKPLRAVTLSDVERQAISGYAFLSLKPLLLVLNVPEDAIGDPAPPELAAAAAARGGEQN